MADISQPTREVRYRAWRAAGFGSDEAWRRADMPGVQPPTARPRPKRRRGIVPGNRSLHDFIMREAAACSRMKPKMMFDRCPEEAEPGGCVGCEGTGEGDCQAVMREALP